MLKSIYNPNIFHVQPPNNFSILISLLSCSIRHTQKSYFLLHLIQMLQTFSIIIRPFQPHSPSWDYSTFSPIFIRIGVISRPLTLSHFTDATIVCLFFALMSICILGMVYSSYKKVLIHRYTDSYYRPSKLDIYLGYLRCFMIEVGFIPEFICLLKDWMRY